LFLLRRNGELKLSFIFLRARCFEMDITTDVLIVGAGGGGAVLSIALARKGIANLVLEQAAGPPQGLRGEILQPNGQALLHKLGLLEKLPPHASKPVRLFHFRQCGGTRLCTIDYEMLSPPFNRALVMWPNVVHHTILDCLQQENPDGLSFQATFKSFLRHGKQVIGAQAKIGGASLQIGARVVGGADGPFSHVREAMGISASLHRYTDSYLVAALDAPEVLDEAQYYVGQKTILGLFPAPEQKVYALYMVSSDSLASLKAQGVGPLREKWKTIAPDLAPLFDSLVDWKQTAYMGTGRVRAKTWAIDGAVLMGDAAHGMNPHASQGRMQAMEDAVTLANVLEDCQRRQDWSVNALRTFEAERRSQVTMLQQLADEEVFFWNTGNPILGLLRDRVFRIMDTNRRLQYQVLSATAGLRTTPPFGWLDRFQADGFLPDPRANQVPGPMQLA
jgi:2-polyprenyl-6-methoxyphenol hydroxylase-like FAD-dependent oxidoreductase